MVCVYLMRGYLAIKGIGTFSGTFFGWYGSCAGEIVKFQSLNFCWDILTDPAYKKKIVITDSVAVDNRQPTPDEIQSFMSHLEGMVFLGNVGTGGNGSGKNILKSYFETNRITGFIPDRKELLRDLLEFSSLTTGGIDENREEAIKGAISPVLLDNDDLKKLAAPEEFYWDLATGNIPEEKFIIAVWDFGANYNLFRSLRLLGCRVRIAPPHTDPEDIVALHPDAVVISGGPTAARNSDRYLPKIERMVGIRPLLGIGGGAALLARALGMKTKPIGFPHFGNSIPVEDTKTGKVEASYQTHSIAIDPGSARDSGIKITHVNVCDGSIEGFSVPEYETAGSFCLPTVEYLPGYFEGFINNLNISYAN
jgi:carbamoyl-phosphate synthase small subunit